MLIKENALTFIGNHPESNRPICGIISASLDVEHAPFCYALAFEAVIIYGNNKTVHFAVPESLILAIEKGFDFYLGNINGSEESHLLMPCKHHH